MTLLDIRTLILTNVITAIVCMMVNTLLWYQSRKRFRGTAFWVFAFAFQTIALHLIVLHGTVPDVISIVIPGSLIVGGALLGYIGLERFIGKRSSQVHNYVLLAAFILVHSYFSFSQPNLGARTLNLSVGLLIICFQCMWLMLFRVQPVMRQLTLTVGMVFGAYCLVSVARIVHFFIVPHPSSEYLQSGPFESIILISYQVLFILLTYSLVLMVNKRLLAELKSQEEKFSKAFNFSPYAIVLSRLSDGKIIEINDGFVNVTGYQRTDIKGRTTIDLHLWNREEDRTAAVSELLSSGRVYEREFQFRKKSGGIFSGLLWADIIMIDNESCALSSIYDVSARKQVEVELAKSEERYRELVENANSIIIRMDRSGKITFLNEYAQKFFGYSLDEILGKNVKILVPQIESGSGRSLEEMMDDILKNPDAFVDNISENIRKNGEHIWISWRNKGIKAPDGSIIGNLAIGQDITERKQAEEVLRETHDRAEWLARFPAENPNPVMRASVEGIVLYCNPSSKKLHGWKCDVGEELPETLLHLPKRAVTQGREVEEELKLGERFYSVTVVPVPGEGYTNIYGRDITERKQAELALGQSEERYRSLFENMLEGYAYCRMIFEEGMPQDFIYLDVNSSFERLTGLKNVIGKRVSEVVPGIRESNPELFQIYDRVVSTGNPEKFETYLDLLQSWFSVTAYGAGEGCFVAIFENITGRKTLEENIRALNEKLEEQVKQRTAQLETANKELEAFSYSVSHDLRAPLRAIDGFSQALLEEYLSKLDDVGQDYLERIHGATKKMDFLIDDMLKLARVSQPEIRRESISLSELVRKVTEKYQDKSPDRVVQVSIEDNVIVKGDPYLMRIALENLVDNAWKFTSKNLKTEIEFGSVQQDGETIYFVRDNGVGFDMTYADKLFGTFQRLHTSDEFPGTGIGLATVRRIIHRHGGRVWGEGIVGKGAAFYFTLMP